MEESIQHIISLKNNKDIEQAAGSLSFEDAKKLVGLLAAGHCKEKVAPVIAGLPLSYIPELLLERLPFFKNCVGLESLQHKLILLSAEIAQDLKNRGQAILEVEDQIRILPATMLYEQCHPILKQLSYDVNHIEKTIHVLVELAWLTERVDLIELCNQLKEHFVHLYQYMESLTQSFKGKLNTLFGPEEANAIEGLATMGLLYPEDWKIFLKNQGENVQFLSEKLLISKTDDVLKKAGLKTVKDLKEKELYTLALLNQYIYRNTLKNWELDKETP